MKFLLIYFTGTYNTRYITNLLKDKIIKQGDSVTTIEVNINTKNIDLNEYDVIGIGYPIYAFNCPQILINYLKKLKLLNNKKYFIYKNSGESLGVNNASSRKIKHLFRKNKIKINNEYHFLMPYNIMFRFEDNCIKELLGYNSKLADILLYELTNNKKHIIKNNFIYEINSLIFTLQRFGGWFNSYFYRVNQDKCINCNLCVNSCPTNNIFVSKDGSIKFKHNCLMCMRCSMSCPKDAINIGILNNWKVNQNYDFSKIVNDQTLDGNFINKTSKKFFNCYKEDYKYINKKYNEYFNK